MHWIKTGKGKMIHEEKSMGTDSEVPYFLIPERESTPGVVDTIVNLLEEDQRNCTKPPEPIVIEVFGQKVTVTFEIKHTQFDRSLIEKISGLGGAVCTMVVLVVEF